MPHYVEYFLLAFHFTSTYQFPIEEEFESEPSLRSGTVIDKWNETWDVNADELGEYFQGDIITTTTDLRSITVNESLRWPNGIVPFEITGPYTDEGLGLLEWAMNQYHEHTCVRFKAKEREDEDYLHIMNTFTGCWSSLGRQGGKQDINLQHPGCLNAQRRGTAIHEMMHALGVKHEHTRIDRDKYVRVLEENINPARMVNFQKSKDDEATNYDVPYDFGSVMHYSMFAFSTDYGKKHTLEPKNPADLKSPDGTTIKMGQRLGFGVNDIKKLNKMYCPNGEMTEEGSVINLRKEPDESETIAEWWSNLLESLQETLDSEDLSIQI